MKLASLRYYSVILSSLSLLVTPLKMNAQSAITLTPEKACSLAQAQNFAIKASHLSLAMQKKTVDAAFSSFFPIITATSSVNHIVEKPPVGTMPDLSGYITMLKQSPFASPVDTTILNLLGIVLGGLSNSYRTPNNLYSIGASFVWPIFTGGKISNAYEIAKTTLQSQEASLARTVTDIGFSAKQMYWGYVGMIKSLESIQETLWWLENLYQTQKRLFDNGIIIELDLLNTQLQVDNFKLTQLKMNDAVILYRDQLLFFLGLPVGTSITVDTSLVVQNPDTVALLPTEKIETIVDNRDDLKALKLQIETMKMLKKIQTSAYIPSVTAICNSAYSNQYSLKENNLQRTTTIGLSFNWMLFDYGKAFKEVQKTDLQIELAEVSYHTTREQIMLKMRSLAKSVEQSRKAQMIAKEDMDIAEKALKIAQLKYDAQSITNTELLNSRNVLTNKVVAYTQARIAMILGFEEFRTVPYTNSQMQSGPK